MGSNGQFDRYSDGQRDPLPYVNGQSNSAIDPIHLDVVEEELFHKYWRILYGRRWIILATTLLGLVIAAVHTLRQPRLYQAQATVEFKDQLPPGKELDFARESNSVIPPEVARRLLTTRILAAKIIKAEEEQRAQSKKEIAPTAVQPQEVKPSIWRKISDGIQSIRQATVARARAILGSDLRESPDDAKKEEALKDADLLGVSPWQLSAYYSHFSIYPVPGTSMVDIAVTHTTREMAALMANRHAQTFIEMDVETKIASLNDAQGIIRQQLLESKAKMEDARRALSEFQQENGILSLPKDNTTMARESLQQLNSMLTAAQGERITAEANYQSAKRMDPQELAENLPNPALQTLRDELLVERTKYDELTRNFGPNHPDMVVLRSRIEMIEGQLRASGSQTLDQLRAILQVAEAKEHQLKETFEDASKEANREDRKLIQLLVLQREVDSYQALYANLLDQAKQADLYSGGFRWGSVKLVDRALVPMVPSFPRPSRNLGMGLMLGFLAGVLGILLVDRLDTRIHTPDEAEALLHVPAFGIVPDFDRVSERSTYGPVYGRRSASSTGNDRVAPELVLLRHPTSIVSEAYRGIRTNILFSSPGSPPKVILITSGQAGEGKTVTALNLSISLALLHYRVLIIDADMRRPSCHKVVKIAQLPGLTDILTGHCDVTEAIVPLPLLGEGTVNGNGNGHANGAARSGVSVIPAGTHPPNPAELLGSSAMSDLLATMRDEFDFVLIDSPPIMPVTDSVMLSTRVDGVVMVVRGGEWGREVARRAMSQLEHVRARVLGVVLNRVDVKRGGSSGYYYRYHQGYGAYYGNGQDHEPKQEKRDSGEQRFEA